ncbi:MAG: hypothetical protein A4E19_16590 [Nitrospira sp. SG-bin1]|nr:MAG: hypothetical protein A4E19_16590 [Nitrospira sp. SG-bin1]
MKSIIRGREISRVEVTNISKHGLWLLTSDSELFMSFKTFPQFLDTSVSKIMNVELLHSGHLHWPDLNIDVAVASVRCFPLASNTHRPITRSGR